jgi:anti-anti-sigma factor
MSRDRYDNGQARAGIALESLPSAAGRGGVGEDAVPAGGRPWLRVRIIERTALIRFEDAELLFDEEVIRVLGEQLDRLIQDGGHSRLLVNLGGVRYLSSAVLGKLAWLEKQVAPVGGRIQVCGLDPLVRELLQITRLDGVLDVCGDETEALGLIVR